MRNEFQGIDCIRINNYKSIGEATLNIRPITVLAGANSTGKSNVMQPLLLMKQTFEMQKQSSTPLSLKGENVEMSSFEDISTKILGATSDSFSVQIESNSFRAKSVFKNDRGGIDLLETTFNYFDQPTKDYLWSSLADTETKRPINSITLSDTVDVEELFRWMFIPYPGLRRLPFDANNFIPLKDKCFYSVGLVELPDNVDGLPTRLRPSEHLIKDIQGIIHLPRWRAINDDKVSLSPPLYPGTFQNYTAGLIAHWEKHDPEKYLLLVEYLNSLRLSTSVSTARKGESLGILLGWHHTIPPKNKNDMVNIANVGVGVSQALPILVALIAAEPKQIVYVEQPEVHLHPRVHIGLVEAIMDAARRKVKVVVETHSETFLLALQTVIAEQYAKENSKDRVERKDIVLYWFSRGEDGATTPEEGSINEDGTYGSWPVDFSSVTGKLQRRYLETMRDEIPI